MGNAVPGIPPSTSAPQSLCAVAPEGVDTSQQGQQPRGPDRLSPV